MRRTTKPTLIQKLNLTPKRRIWKYHLRLAQTTVESTHIKQHKYPRSNSTSDVSQCASTIAPASVVEPPRADPEGMEVTTPVETPEPQITSTPSSPSPSDVSQTSNNSESASDGDEGGDPHDGVATRQLSAR